MKRQINNNQKQMNQKMKIKSYQKGVMNCYKRSKTKILTILRGLNNMLKKINNRRTNKVIIIIMKMRIKRGRTKMIRKINQKNSKNKIKKEKMIWNNFLSNIFQ